MAANIGLQILLCTMKYRLTPFHLLALIVTIQMILEIIEVSREYGDPGLGGLGPYVMFGLLILILFVDLLIQMIIKRTNWILAIEIPLIVSACIYYYIKIP